MKNKHAQSLANLRWATKTKTTSKFDTTYAKSVRNYTFAEKTIQKPLKVNFQGRHWKTIRFQPSAFQDVKTFVLVMAVVAIPILAASFQHYLEQ